MQYAWLEKLASEGHISEKAKDAIYRDCGQILKIANEKFIDPKGPGAQLAGLIFMGGAGAAGKKILDIHKVRSTAKKIVANRNALLAEEDLKPYQDKVKARFRELAMIAPTVATMPNMAGPMVRKRLHDGFTDQDINHLATLQANYSSKDPMFAAKSLARMDKIAQEKVGELYADLFSVVDDMGVKLAGVPNQASRYFKRLLMLSAAPVVAGASMGAVNHLINMRGQKKVKENLDHSFNSAMRMGDPDKNPLIANKDKARQAFETLAYFAPHVALQPSAAKAFMDKLVAYDMVSVPDIKELSEIERNMHQTRNLGSSPFSQGFEAGTKVLTLGSSMVSLEDKLSKGVSSMKGAAN